MLNLRGSDVNFNPVFKSYLYLQSNGSGVLFINDEKLTEEVRQYLGTINVAVSPYE